MEDTLPARTAALAHRVAAQTGDVDTVTRFPTGLCHYVYDVVLRGGERLVVRVAAPENRHLLAGAVAWSRLLRPLGVPLPALLHEDVQAPLPYLVLERLPGDDLGTVFATLTPEQRRVLAGSVATVQRAVGSLGEGQGYGYSADPTRPAPRARWSTVVLDNLRRSGARLATSEPPLRDLHRRVLAEVALRRAQLDATPAVPFLDDLTTKNVLVDAGRLTGVVDVDVVCFGDPLLTPALTKVALVAAAQPVDYVETWLEHADLAAAMPVRFDLYCAVFCLDLLSEVDQAFNRTRPLQVERARLERLQDLLATLVEAFSPSKSSGVPWPTREGC